MIYKYFLPFCRLSFHFLDNVLWCTIVFNFDECQFIYLLLSFMRILPGLFKSMLITTITTTLIITLNTNTEGGSHRRASMSFSYFRPGSGANMEFPKVKKYEAVDLKVFLSITSVMMYVKLPSQKTYKNNSLSQKNLFFCLVSKVGCLNRVRIPGCF